MIVIVGPSYGSLSRLVPTQSKNAQTIRKMPSTVAAIPRDSATPEVSRPPTALYVPLFRIDSRCDPLGNVAARVIGWIAACA